MLVVKSSICKQQIILMILNLNIFLNHFILFYARLSELKIYFACLNFFKLNFMLYQSLACPCLSLPNRKDYHFVHTINIFHVNRNIYNSNLHFAFGFEFMRLLGRGQEGGKVKANTCCSKDLKYIKNKFLKQEFSCDLRCRNIFHKQRGL